MERSPEPPHERETKGNGDPLRDTGGLDRDQKFCHGSPLIDYFSRSTNPRRSAIIIGGHPSSTAAFFGGSLSPRRFWTGGRGCPVGAGEGGLPRLLGKVGCRTRINFIKFDGNALFREPHDRICDGPPVATRGPVSWDIPPDSFFNLSRILCIIRDNKMDTK